MFDQRITNIGEVVTYDSYLLPNGATMSGDFRPLTLACGHIAPMNARNIYKIGELVRCYQCEETKNRRAI